ncbi:hypothetical protein [Streptomyces hoynatensis]|uniref:SCO2583/SCO2584 N-terminal domain-containing protein n=1 Tax=Streptomyces hoynatensis TaxID=1141874 RepID=UPI001319D6C8|nr:hypothetical protein [Streptomyces hoynatensis]
MPDDVGGPPLPDGEGAEGPKGPESRDRSAAEEFPAVVLDDAFVEAAEIHEPTAAERLRLASTERAEPEAAGEFGFGYLDGPAAFGDPGGYPGGEEDPDDALGEFGEPGDFGEFGAGPFGPGEGPGGYGEFGRLGGLGGEGFEAQGGGFDRLPGPGLQDDEGRFDRSDYLHYLRYLPEQDEAEEFGLGPCLPPAGYGGAPIPAPGHRAQPHSWRPVRWQRPVACVLAMVMGISVIAFALIAIQRAGSAGSGDPGGGAPPASERDQPEEEAAADAEVAEGTS